jgi:tetratricopeptide (TPR) repeat protein
MKFSRIIAIISASILLFTGAASYAQKDEKSKSSISSKFRKSAPRESTSQLLFDANNLKDKSPSEALEKVKEALANSIREKNILSEGKCYLLLGEINMNIQEWKLAAENFLTAYQKLEYELPNSQEFRNSIRGLGEANLKLGNYDESQKYFEQLLSKNLLSVEKAEARLAMSEVLCQTGRYDEALKEVEKIELSNKRADPGLEVKIENQKAKIYAQNRDVDRARERYESSQRIAQSNSIIIPEKDKAVIESAKEEISTALNEQKRYDDEISLRNSSIQYNLDLNDLGEVSKDKVELSKALVAKGETSAAIRELEEAAHIADTIGDPKKQAIAFLSLAQLHEKYGNYSKAITTYNQYSLAVEKADKARENKLLEKSELIRMQRDIEEVAKYVSLAAQEEQIAQAMVSRQRLIIYGLVAILGIIMITSYYIYKNAQASKTANQLLALKSLRSQMNPHFIFNALNSLNHFVSQNDERTANKFLSEFSRLMRLVLENSQQDFIPLYKEEEIVSLYLKLEHYRFRDKFDYNISIDENINKEAIQVPPMLIQPYIENAVWHGLRYKESKGYLSLHIRQQDHELIVEIQDDGIGRQRSAELKTENQKKHNSTGLKNIRERLGIINNIYKANYKVFIEDIAEGKGTKVQLHLPVKNKLNAYA